MAVSLYDLQGVIELMQSLKLQFLQIHEQNSKRFRELHNAHPPNYKPHGVLISLSNIDSTWIGTFFCYYNDYLPTCLNLVVMYIYIIAFIFFMLLPQISVTTYLCYLIIFFLQKIRRNGFSPQSTFLKPLSSAVRLARHNNENKLNSDLN